MTHIENNKKIRWADVNIIIGENGKIGVLEASKQVGFDIKRIYFLTDLDEGAQRGGHAHKKLKQCFICLRGRVTIDIRTNDTVSTIELRNYQRAVVLQEGCWRELRNFSSDALLLVLASEEYDESDYIRDLNHFTDWESQDAVSPTVPYIDLARTGSDVFLEIDRAVEAVIRSGTYIGGPHLEAFEKNFARYCHSSHCVGVANGLDALKLTLRAWGVSSNDEVIVPAHTFVATALAVTEIGATPIFVDVDYRTGLIDVDQIEAAITSRTKAIIPVHLYGHPADMDRIMSIAQHHGIHVLEDAAQAHGADYKGRRVGSLGHAAAFSFYPTKNLGALGDAGAVVTSEKDIADDVRCLGNYGSSTRYVHDVLGTNSRLDPIQAAVLDVKLKRLDDWNLQRQDFAKRYMMGLNNLPGLVLPEVKSWAKPVWHVFPVSVPERRDAVRNALTQAGIGTNLHYPIPLPAQPCYQAKHSNVDFPSAMKIAASGLSLPLHPSHSLDEINRVVDVVRDVLRA